MAKQKQINYTAKGVAIPYIIALIIGFVVFGVIGYWFFSLAGRGGGVATTVGCDAKILSYCQAWRDVGWLAKPVLQAWDKSCGQEPINPKACSDRLGLTCDCLSVQACKDGGFNNVYGEPLAGAWKACGTFCCK